MPYQSAVSEYQFIFDHIIPLAPLLQTEKFADFDRDDVNAIMVEGAKLCDTTIAPLQREGDLNPAKLIDGRVQTAAGFKGGYSAIADGGWVGISAQPENGGMGLPITVASAINDMMAGACISLQLCPLLSQGQIDALEHHASDEIKALYLPKLTSGQWTGTMNLTEPQAGSDVGALNTRAQKQPDGTYKITGQKIFITWGDHDVEENICHLVLARLPDGVAGPKGISLFLVPKFIPNNDGVLGAENDLRCVSLEHKLGIHGSPTAVMEYAGATGWLVGHEHGGMAAMFTMMNNARLAVGMQGIGVAEAAYQHARDYALTRKQGRAMRADAQGSIIDHADVRRMMLTMKTDLFAARCIGMACSFAIDMAAASDHEKWQNRAAFLTPIAKSFGSDTGVTVADTSVQIYGGMGYIEETAAAQFLRDVRITPIYEGTNGIQAMDLVGRKMMDGGAAAHEILDEMQSISDAADPQHSDMAMALRAAAAMLRETTDWIAQQADLNDRFAGAIAYQKAFARIMGAGFHLRAAASNAPDRAELAQFYFNAILPEYISLCQQAKSGAADLYALSIDAF